MNCYKVLAIRQTTKVTMMPHLRRWSAWRRWSIVTLLYIACCCQASAITTETAMAAHPIPREAVDNPSYWLKNTHSSTCPKFSVRTFLVDTKEGDPLSLVIRQNIRGSVVVQELPKKPASGHKVQVALNWTATGDEILAALKNSYKVVDMGSEKLVLMQVFVGDIKSETNLSPVVIGSTVTGFLVLMGLIVVALYMARRKANATPERESVGSPSELSDTDDDDDEDEDTDFYHPSLYNMSTSHGAEDDSLDLSVMRDLQLETSYDTHTEPSPARNTSQTKENNSSLQMLTGSVREKSRTSKDNKSDDLPPPPPPPPAEFEFRLPSSIEDVNAESPLYQTLFVENPKSLSIPGSSADTLPPNYPAAVYAVPNKNKRPPPPPLSKNPPTLRPQALDSDSDQSSKTSSGSGGSGGYVGSSLLGRTVMIVGMISVITQVAFSMCHEDISVSVLVFIPTNAKINSIHLYSNKDTPSVFEHTDWYLNNAAKFKTFDVDDASDPGDINPCTAKVVCPTAANQTFLGCDWKSQKCVCKRGWTLNNKQICVDVDECEMGRCPPSMACTNYPGSYSCSCNTGKFWNGEECQTCNVGCRDGMFQSNPCNSTMDRTCKTCSQCSGGTFTFKPCTGMEDSQCMDVAQPYLQYPNAAKIDSNQVALESSPNTFVEELHKTSDLSYPLFISDNSQFINFVWPRTSGIRVLIKVSDFNIIPQFEDVDHENDNIFVQAVMPKQKPFLNQIIYNNCRSPIPDYYMLTMNKFKDRTTVVRDVVCNRTLNNCPPRFSDGQAYKFRTYNTQCPKTTIPVDELSDEGNSVICNERTPLLSDIFNETLNREETLTFPSIGCKQQIWKCKECFSQRHCGELGINESCCAVGCHAQRVCKEAVSDACSASPVECAKGDTVQFIVQPHFIDLSSQFLCHLKRKQPKSIFKLSYHIVVPTPDGWNSSRREVDLPTGGESQATQVSDYITIKYNNYLDTSADGNMILRGDFNAMREEYDFSLFEFKPISEFNKTKVKPVKYSTMRNQDVITSSIQNERPFDISTWNFNSKHGCYADTRKIHGKQLMYNNETGQHVQMNTLKFNRGFTYDVRSVSNTPQVDFYLPGNESILFHYLPNSTLDYKSVKVDLVNKAEPFYVYAIRVSGTMKSCNSYLGINIYDKTTKSTIAAYDAMIYCTANSNDLPTFNFNIKIPEKGSKNKLLAVTLRDSFTTVSYFVTTYTYSSSLLQNNTLSLYSKQGAAKSQHATYFAMLTCLGAIGFAFGLLYFLISYQHIAITRFRSLKDKCTYAVAQRRFIVTMCIIFKFIYSVAFSLSVLVLLLKLVCSKDLTSVSDMTSYNIEIKKLVERNIQAITEFKRNEIGRQNDMKRERLEACSGYANESVEALRSYVNKYSAELQDKKNAIEDKKFELLMKEIQGYLADTKVHVDKHKKDVNSQIRDILSEYSILLEEITKNEWFTFPYINYKSIENRTTQTYSPRLMSEEAVDFLSYVGVDRPSAAYRQVQLLNEQLNNMYKDMSFNIDSNLGLGFLQGLDTSSVSMLSLKKLTEASEKTEPAFAIEGDGKVKSGGTAVLIWITIISCDILIFIYRMSALSHTLYRLNNGYVEEEEISSGEKVLEEEHEEQIEMNTLESQNNGEEEMTKSLLDDIEQPDENKNFQDARKPASRAQSESGASASNQSDLEQPKMKGSEMGSVSKMSSRPGSAMSEAASARGEAQRASRATSRAASATGSVRYYAPTAASRTKSPSVHSSHLADNKPLSRGTASPEDITDAENGSAADSSRSIHPGGCAANKLGRLLLSKYTIPTILWLASQFMAVILIFVLTEIITYSSVLQLTNIESMISHIGMYVSVVNSYVTTHAQLISQVAQETMVQEFNLHLHHIAKVKAILESDLNWSLMDYSSKQCVLDGKLIEHCTYQNQLLDVNVMPCQSFPIEAIQYTEQGGLNADLVSTRILGFTESLISVIISSLSLITFYINAVAIIHIVSLVVNKILHHKGAIHIITVKYTRNPIPVMEPKGNKRPPMPSTASLATSQQSDSAQTSDDPSRAIEYSARSSRHDMRSEGTSYYTHHSLGSRRLTLTEEEDPLLKTIKAQSSLTRQSTEEQSEESSALITSNRVKIGGTITSTDQSASETEF